MDEHDKLLVDCHSHGMPNSLPTRNMQGNSVNYGRQCSTINYLPTIQAIRYIKKERPAGCLAEKRSIPWSVLWHIVL